MVKGWCGELRGGGATGSVTDMDPPDPYDFPISGSISNYMDIDPTKIIEKRKEGQTENKDFICYRP